LLPVSEPHASDAGGEKVEAALESVQPDRLLSGERPDTPYLEDAHHWIKVYSELREFKADVLRLAEERVRSMGRDSAAEVRDTDLKVLRAEAGRINRRMTYWRDRVASLEMNSDPA